jgi:hypothetical protein
MRGSYDGSRHTQAGPEADARADGKVFLTNNRPGGTAMNQRRQLALSGQTDKTEGSANTRLSRFAVVVLIANVLAATLAVVVNWPSQFGGVVGTDAGQDWLSRGTAISAPLAPVTCFVLTAILVRF